MTKARAISQIRAAFHTPLPADAEVRAEGLLESAVLIVGRTKNVHWNRDEVTITLTADKATYKIGSEILSDYGTIKNLQTLWRSDVQRDPIPIVDIAEFNKYARGSSAAGEPALATLYAEEETLGIYPTPSANYTLWGYIQKKITEFDKIPEEYHDVVVNTAIALMNPSTAAQMAFRGIEDMKEDSITRWSGNTIPISRSLGGGKSPGTSSSNLRGD